MKSLTRKALKELLIKCWMTHDGMWFYHCLKECGIEKVNKINKAAVKSMAKIEIKRIKTAFNLKKINNFQDLQNLINKALEVFKADFMGLTFNFPSNNQIHFDMNPCFAYNGINRLGVIDKYECGIFDRIEGWLDALDIKYNVIPKVEGCLMHTNGNCFRDYFLFFNE